MQFDDNTIAINPDGSYSIGIINELENETSDMEETLYLQYLFLIANSKGTIQNKKGYFKTSYFYIFNRFVPFRDYQTVVEQVNNLVDKNFLKLKESRDGENFYFQINPKTYTLISKFFVDLREQKNANKNSGKGY